MTDRLNASGEKQRKRTAQEWCERSNALLAGTEPTMKGEYLSPRNDVEWIVADGKPVIRWKKTALGMIRETIANRGDVMDRRGQPMSDSDTFALNKKLEELGATARYHSDGTRYFIETSR